MVTTSERQKQRKELGEAGYAWDYVDGWQPKTNLYRHAPGLSATGETVFPVGSLVKGVPGSPDYVLRKARIGMFQRPPGDTCECRWCVERAVEEKQEVSNAETGNSQECEACGIEISTSGNKGALASKMRSHMKQH